MAGILASVGVPVLINALSETLKTIQNPLTQGAAKALEAVDGAIQNGQITNEQVAEANRHAERMAELQTQSQGEVNQSLRAEIASSDAYVRRMRPTFGYIMAVTWGAQMLAIAYVVVFETNKAFMVLNAMESLSAIWAMGLSVLGIYVYKRSEEKKIAPRGESILWNRPKG